MTARGTSCSPRTCSTSAATWSCCWSCCRGSSARAARCCSRIRTARSRRSSWGAPGSGSRCARGRCRGGPRHAPSAASARRARLRAVPRCYRAPLHGSPLRPDGAARPERPARSAQDGGLAEVESLIGAGGQHGGPSRLGRAPDGVRDRPPARGRVPPVPVRGRARPARAARHSLRIMDGVLRFRIIRLKPGAPPPPPPDQQAPRRREERETATAVAARAPQTRSAELARGPGVAAKRRRELRLSTVP